MTNNRYNIWMISKWYPNREDPQIGVFIQKHAQAIAQYNDITVLFIHSCRNLTDLIEMNENEKNGVREIIIYFRKNTSIFSRIINFSRYIIALIKGIRILNKKYPDPDIIHAYILIRTGVVAWYLSRRKKIPYIISEQWSGYVTGKYLNSSAVKKMITRFLITNASAVTSVSGFLLKRMQDCGLANKNYRVIPNIIENIIPASMARHNSIVNVLIVADLVDDIKNISGVIRMIGSLEEDLPFNLRIIGAGQDDKKLKELASGLHLLNKKIFFEGLKTNEEVYIYLQRCDFLVMNSRYETFSLICAEAMSCGKPVLATRCGGPNEFVNTETGILIEPDDDEALRNNFLYLLSHYKNYDSAGIIKYANDLFSREKAGMAFKQLYTSLIRG